MTPPALWATSPAELGRQALLGDREVARADERHQVRRAPCKSRQAPSGPSARPSVPGGIFFPQRRQGVRQGRCRPVLRRDARCRRCGRSAGRWRPRRSTACKCASRTSSRGEVEGLFQRNWRAGASHSFTSGASVWRVRMAVDTDQIGAGLPTDDMFGHGLGRLLAASVERPLMVVQPGSLQADFACRRRENGSWPCRSAKTLLEQSLSELP